MNLWSIVLLGHSPHFYVRQNHMERSLWLSILSFDSRLWRALLSRCALQGTGTLLFPDGFAKVSLSSLYPVGFNVLGIALSLVLDGFLPTFAFLWAKEARKQHYFSSEEIGEVTPNSSICFIERSSGPPVSSKLLDIFCDTYSFKGLAHMVYHAIEQIASQRWIQSLSSQYSAVFC